MGAVRLSILEKESIDAGDCMASVSRDSLAAAASWSAKSGSAGGTLLSVTMWFIPGGRPPPSLALPAEELALRLLLGDPKDALRPNDGRRSRLRSRSFWSLLRASRDSRSSEGAEATVGLEEEDVFDWVLLLEWLLKREDEKKGAAVGFCAGVAPPLRCIMTV